MIKARCLLDHLTAPKIRDAVGCTKEGAKMAGLSPHLPLWNNLEAHPLWTWSDKLVHLKHTQLFRVKRNHLLVGDRSKSDILYTQQSTFTCSEGHAAERWQCVFNLVGLVRSYRTWFYF